MYTDINAGETNLFRNASEESAQACIKWHQSASQVESAFELAKKGGKNKNKLRQSGDTVREIKARFMEGKEVNRYIDR